MGENTAVNSTVVNKNYMDRTCHILHSLDLDSNVLVPFVERRRATFHSAVVETFPSRLAYLFDRVHIHIEQHSS